MAKKRNPKNWKVQGVIILLTLIVLLISALTGLELPAEVAKSLPQPFSQLFAPTTKKNTQSKTESFQDGQKQIIDHGKSTFSAAELAESPVAQIEYHELDSLGRATGADAILTKKLVGTGTSADKNIRPVGFISGLKPYYHSRGHLIGKQFGGSGDDERNLVCIYQNPVNTPNMTKYENQVRQALDNGDIVRYRVTPHYNEKQLMCESLTIEAKSLTTSGKIDFNVTLVNRQKERNQ